MKKLMLLLVLLFFSYNIVSKIPDRSVHLIVCDVGQGDAILIQQGYFQALIDTGPDESVTSCLRSHMPKEDKKIDILVLTHYDNDHIGGFAASKELYQFGEIYAPLTDKKESQVFLELEESFLALLKQGTVLKQPILGQQIAYHNFSLEYNSPELIFSFITPTFLETDWQIALQAFQAGTREPETQFSWWQDFLTEKSHFPEQLESVNDRSISFLIQYGDLKIFLSGDLEEGTELSILESRLIAGLDILKVAHHGSKSSSSMPFLLETHPETALISSGEGNSFGHPATEVLERLSLFAQQIGRTDHSGELHLVLKSDFYYFLK